MNIPNEMSIEGGPFKFTSVFKEEPKLGILTSKEKSRQRKIERHRKRMELKHREEITRLAKVYNQDEQDLYDWERKHRIVEMIYMFGLPKEIMDRGTMTFDEHMAKIDEYYVSTDQLEPRIDMTQPPQ